MYISLRPTRSSVAVDRAVKHVELVARAHVVEAVAGLS